MTAPFSPADVERAKALYNANPTREAQAFLDLLIDHPGEMFDSDAVQVRLELEDHRDVARTAYQLGVLAGAMGRSRPWNEAQRGYVMSNDVALLFRQARDQETASA